MQPAAKATHTGLEAARPIAKEKTALVAFRRRVYPVSTEGLWAFMELTRGPVDRDQAIGFVLRQEGYEISAEEKPPAS
jgi:hypothetical protein